MLGLCFLSLLSFPPAPWHGWSLSLWATREAAEQFSWKQGFSKHPLVKGRSCPPIIRQQQRQDNLVMEKPETFLYTAIPSTPPTLPRDHSCSSFPFPSLLLSAQTLPLGTSKHKACKEDAHKIFMEDCGEHK